MMMGSHACFICHHPVLGLHSQDVKWDTYLLTSSPADSTILEAGAYGYCHIRCTTQSEVGRFWIGRLRKNFDEHELPVIYIDEDLVIYRHQYLRETRITRADGWYAIVGDAMLNKGIAVGDEWLSPTKHDLEILLPNHSNVTVRWNEILYEGKRKDARIDIAEVVESLRIREYLLSQNAILNGLLSPSSSMRKHLKSNPRYQFDYSLRASATYYWVFPLFIRQLVLRLLKGEI